MAPLMMPPTSTSEAILVVAAVIVGTFNLTRIGKK